jgi:tetratricopeptide (TPR) repeat protein
MSTAFQRGIVLFNQNRHDLADREFRQELAESPDNALAHAFLALCLTEQDRKDEARREADEAIRLDPGIAFCHYVLGRVLCGQDRLKDAEAAVQEAIRLDPDDADYLGLLSSIEIGRSRWEAALAAADRGLALDPEHNTCINLRALALVQLGRKAEAEQTLGSALANDPENALTHANQGWALLHRSDHRRALEHFREALRIDPELEWARSGIVEALKARYLIYRLMLRFFLWMGRQTRLAQWVVILGFVFGRQILASVARANPALAPFVIPILVLSFAFLMLTWISSPLFNLALRFNRFGRLALSREQRIASSWIGGCFLLAAASFFVYIVNANAVASFGMLYFGLLLLPLAVTFGRPPGRARWVMAAYTGALVLMGLPILSMILLDRAGPWKNIDLALRLFQYFLYGAILSTWMPALLRSSSWAQS